MGKITFGSTYSEILKVVDKLQYYEKFYICSGIYVDSPYSVYREVMKYDGIPIAFIEIFRFPHNPKDVGFLITACVEEFRHKNYVTLLIWRALSILNNMGIKYLLWSVKDGNDNSVKFAKKLGFKINQKTPISVIEKTTYPILKREHLIE